MELKLRFNLKVSVSWSGKPDKRVALRPLPTGTPNGERLGEAVREEAIIRLGVSPVYGDDDRIMTAPPVTVEGYFVASNRESRAANTTAASDSSSNPALGSKLNPNAAAMSENVIPAYDTVQKCRTLFVASVRCSRGLEHIKTCAIVATFKPFDS